MKTINLSVSLNLFDTQNTKAMNAISEFGQRDSFHDRQDLFPAWVLFDIYLPRPL